MPYCSMGYHYRDECQGWLGCVETLMEAILEVVLYVFAIVFFLCLVAIMISVVCVVVKTAWEVGKTL